MPKEVFKSIWGGTNSKKNTGKGQTNEYFFRFNRRSQPQRLKPCYPMLKKKLFNCAALLLLTISGLSAQVQNIDNIPADSDSVITVGKVYFTGNKKTKASIVLRELSIKEGDRLLLTDLAQKMVLDQQKLINTRLFLFVEIIPLFVPGKPVDVLIKLTERWYIFFYPIFELSDRNFTEWWRNQKGDFSRINYGAELLHANFTGRNDRFKAYMELGLENQFFLGYQLPYVNKKQTLGLALGAGYTTKRILGYNTDKHRLQFLENKVPLRRRHYTYGTLTYRPSFYVTHTFSLAYNRTRIMDVIRERNPKYLVNNQTIQKYFTFSYRFMLDRRDYFAYPLTGSLFSFQFSQFGLGVFNDLNILTSRVTYAKYIPVKKRFFLAARFNLYNNFAGEIPYVARAGFGYSPDFVRGYESFVIESKMLFTARSSLRFRLIDGKHKIKIKGLSVVDKFNTIPFSFYFKVFVDTGWSGNPLPATSNNFFNNQWIGSVGVGIDLITYYDWIFRLEYSYNFQGKAGLFFSNGGIF